MELIRCAALLALVAAPQIVTAIGGERITSEQAFDAVREFTESEKIVVSTVYFIDEEPVVPGGSHYVIDVKAPAEWRGEYEVAASEPRVISMSLDHTYGDEDQPQIPFETAVQRAVKFLRQRAPHFARGQYRLVPEHYLGKDGTRYDLFWYEVLNEHGVLAPWILSVEVDGRTGKVVSYFAPPYRIAGPTIPEVSLAEARRIAALYAPLDPEQHPLEEVALQLTEDTTGIQTLVWNLSQYDVPGNFESYRHNVYVDAVSGDVQYPYHRRGKPRQNEPGIRKGQAALRWHSGRLVKVIKKKDRREGRLWVRVERLRAFGARARTRREGFTLSHQERRADEESLGAEWREYGWWVPLRRAAEALGWRVNWVPSTRSVVISHDRPLLGYPARFISGGSF